MGTLSLWDYVEEQWSKLWCLKVDYMGFCQLRVFKETVMSALSSAGVQCYSLAGDVERHISLWGREESGDVCSLF